VDDDGILREVKIGIFLPQAFESAGGTPVEIANAQANVIYTMGVMVIFTETPRSRCTQRCISMAGRRESASLHNESFVPRMD